MSVQNRAERMNSFLNYSLRDVGINKLRKFDEVIFSFKESKKSVHSRATDLFFRFLKRKKNKSNA